MNRTLIFNPLGGASGDMFLASLLDLGVPQEYLENELKKLSLTEEYQLKVTKTVKKGFSGSLFEVLIKKNKAWKKPENQEVHSHNHTHSHDHHKHSDHSHFHYKDIREKIKNSNLDTEVIENSLKAFNKLAEAEASIHGKEIDTVAFHEVGATDSIIDIVGSCIALNYLNIDTIYSTAIALGQGHVHCAHGKLPLPAPATLKILKGIPVEHSGEDQEMCTPTGATLLASLADFSSPKESMQLVETGYGISHSTPKHSPPFLRACLYENSNSTLIQETLLELRFNIDDMSPEYLSPIIDTFMKAEALDCTITPTLMKKGRLANVISVLSPVHLEEKMTQLAFQHTSTFGVKKQYLTRESLPREFKTLKTKWGHVKVKYSTHGKFTNKYHIEYSDIVKLAQEHGLNHQQILTECYKKIT